MHNKFCAKILKCVPQIRKNKLCFNLEIYIEIDFSENDENIGMGEVDDRVSYLNNLLQTWSKNGIKWNLFCLLFCVFYIIKVKDVVPDIPPTPEDPVRQFFLKLAGDDEEVDWMELKEILDYAMRAG